MEVFLLYTQPTHQPLQTKQTKKRCWLSSHHHHVQWSVCLCYCDPGNTPSSFIHAPGRHTKTSGSCSSFFIFLVLPSGCTYLCASSSSSSTYSFAVCWCCESCIWLLLPLLPHWFVLLVWCCCSCSSMVAAAVAAGCRYRVWVVWRYLLVWLFGWVVVCVWYV
jgi:hypothetical protein